MYLQPDLKPGYNPYLTCEENPEVGMDVGLLILEEGQVYQGLLAQREVAFLLLEGQVQFTFENEDHQAERKNPFLEEAWCLHLPRGCPFLIKAKKRSEIYVQAAENEKDFPAKLYSPKEVMVQHAGANNELLGTMRREIKTFFDYESAPWSNMVLGEVLNFPGRWSSYPPHHHPQPEVYFHRFDHPHGFGASFANGSVFVSKNNGLTVITEDFHSQVAAPGYAMCYVWGIRHLPGNPWQKTRIDNPEHAWLWKKDANEHIFQLEAST